MFESCRVQKRNEVIKSIKRVVLVDDSIQSNIQITFFERDSELYILSSKQLLKELDSFKSNELVDNDRKFVKYEIESNLKNRFLSSNSCIQNIDNFILLQEGHSGDETFEINWWFDKKEIQIKIIPSSELHE